MIQPLNTNVNCCGTTRKQSFGQSEAAGEHKRPSKAARLAGYTATQFALFTSLAAVPRTFINASAGYIVDVTGWFMFFNLCFVLALPGMMLLPKVAPWGKKQE